MNETVTPEITPEVKEEMLNFLMEILNSKEPGPRIIVMASPSGGIKYLTNTDKNSFFTMLTAIANRTPGKNTYD